MLNYLGPNIGPQGPMAATLPPATPGTMPAGIHGVMPSPAPLPPPPMIHPVGGGHATPAALAAILKHAAGRAGAPGPTPPPPEYLTTTQGDGSILLHRKNPDGTPGPIVKVLPPIKQAAA